MKTRGHQYQLLLPCHVCGVGGRIDLPGGGGPGLAELLIADVVGQDGPVDTVPATLQLPCPGRNKGSCRLRIKGELKAAKGSEKVSWAK